MLQMPQPGKPGLKGAAIKRKEELKITTYLMVSAYCNSWMNVSLRSSSLQPQSQSSGPRIFKFRSPMYHSCIPGFNFHCSLTEGRINVAHLSCTNQRHKGSKGSTFNRTFILARQSSHGKSWLPDSFCKKYTCCSRISCLQ